jgi:protein-S-isoprenylcysteine O-methyltransferase Ste14
VAPRVIGLALALVALAVRRSARITLRRHGIDTTAKLTTAHPPRSWAETGLYRLTWHPLYAGHLLFMAGAGMMALGWGGAVVAFAAVPHYGQRAAQEDALRGLGPLGVAP